MTETQTQTTSAPDTQQAERIQQLQAELDDFRKHRALYRFVRERAIDAQDPEVLAQFLAPAVRFEGGHLEGAAEALAEARAKRDFLFKPGQADTTATATSTTAQQPPATRAEAPTDEQLLRLFGRRADSALANRIARADRPKYLALRQAAMDRKLFGK